jgi:hypothetical protein
MNSEERYDVVCMSCDQVFQPLPRSPLWWQAKKSADGGRLDAITVTGEECGCEPKTVEPDAPYRVFGFNEFYEDFDRPFKIFTEAVSFYRRLVKENPLSTIFISGVSKRVSNKLEFIW